MEGKNQGGSSSSSSSFTSETDMEGKKQGDSSSSSSSFTSDLFGSKDSYGSSSSGIFGSIFAPSSKVLGRESLRSGAVEKKHDSATQSWSTKPGAPETTPWSNEEGSQSISNRDTSSFYHQEKVQPCNLCSSIYYGRQDVYSQPQNTQTSGLIKIREKMTLAVLQEETGGKVLSIIKHSLPMACELYIY
ncbi:unnamed protein product [Ilex paraguariensis]|uniref:Uncharacterized protein n=1 Tax=Ilex paraguariensis TaxID=185542 RepID=A0ABC8QYQ5_9AQUA